MVRPEFEFAVVLIFDLLDGGDFPKGERVFWPNAETYIISKYTK